MLTLAGLVMPVVAAAAPAQPTSQPVAASATRLQATEAVPPPAKQLPAAKKVFKEIKGLLGEIENLAGQAQRNRDVVRLNCLKAYAKQIRAQQDSAWIELQSLSALLALLKLRGQPLSRVTDRGYFGRLLEARRRARRLAWEARACAGATSARAPDDLLDAPPPDDDDRPGPRPPLHGKPPLASPANP